MATLHDLSERVERLLLRFGEMQRENALMEQEMAALHAERDSLRSRLAAARSRIDTLIARLPATSPSDSRPDQERSLP
jgi:cell division protein ZapB